MMNALSGVIAGGKRRGGGGGGPIAFIISVSARDTPNSVTTGAIDTTGCTLLVAVLSEYDAGSTGTFSDSKGNTWTISAATLGGSSGISRCRLAFCVPTSVGSGHTFSLNGSSNYPSIAILGFSGNHATPLDQVNGGGDVGGGIVQPGSVTPSEDNELIVTGIADYSFSAGYSINSGFTLQEAILAGGGIFGVGAAYKIQTTAGAENPTWNNGSGFGDVAARIATFKKA